MATAVLLSAPAQASPALQEAMRSVVSVLPELPPDQYRSEEPEGSGVVVRDGRHVVTALHVIDGARAIRVRSMDGDIMSARLLARDLLTDLAVLELDGELPSAAFGVDTRPGEQVCAAGNAFGLGISLTCGVVSGVHKAGVGFNAIEDFVQTDAAVNPGASGGALVDRRGRVVGVLSAIFTKTSDANIGINFAVAAPLVERVVDSLLETGSWSPPRSGVTVAADPPAGETGRMAARVVAITAGSPAQRAGLAVGDRILKAGDRRIQGPADLASVTARLAPPDVLTLEIERDDALTRLDIAFD